jgi:hypothetical protein
LKRVSPSRPVKSSAAPSKRHRDIEISPLKSFDCSIDLSRRCLCLRQDQGTVWNVHAMAFFVSWTHVARLSEKLFSVSLAGASRRIPGFNLRVLSPTLALLPLYRRFHLFQGNPERN